MSASPSSARNLRQLFEKKMQKVGTKLPSPKVNSVVNSVSSPDIKKQPAFLTRYKYPIIGGVVICIILIAVIALVLKRRYNFRSWWPIKDDTNPPSRYGGAPISHQNTNRKRYKRKRGYEDETEEERPAKRPRKSFRPDKTAAELEDENFTLLEDFEQ